MKSFPLYKQYDTKQCGITCLRMICKYYGKALSIEYIARYCHTSNEGASLLGISEGATRLGLQTYAGKLSLEQLLTAPTPCILHWDQSHFVILYRIKKKNLFYIADPGRGKRTYNLSDFKSHWISTIVDGKESGIVLFIKPTPVFETLQEDNVNPKRSLYFLWEYLKQYRKYFAQIFCGNLYKEYSYLKLNELEELPCFGVTIWQPSQLLWSALYYFSSNSFPFANLEKNRDMRNLF